MSLDLQVDDNALARRRASWQPLPPRYTTGVLGKYARLVQGAETGAITKRSRDQWNAVIDGNLTGATMIAREVIAKMRPQPVEPSGA